MPNFYKNVAVLISGEGTNLQCLIDRVAANQLPIRIVCVISNQSQANGLNRAQAANIPIHVIPSQIDFDGIMFSTITQTKYEIDFVILWPVI